MHEAYQSLAKSMVKKEPKGMMESTEINCHFRHMISCYEHDLPLMLILIIWLKQCFSGLSNVKFLPPPAPAPTPFITYSLEGKYSTQPTLKDLEVMLQYPESGVST